MSPSILHPRFTIKSAKKHSEDETKYGVLSNCHSFRRVISFVTLFYF